MVDRSPFEFRPHVGRSRIVVALLVAAAVIASVWAAFGASDERHPSPPSPAAASEFLASTARQQEATSGSGQLTQAIPPKLGSGPISGSFPPLPQRYLMFNPLYSWYGLTNQMMCYAAALRYGMESGRQVAFPVQNMAASFYDLFDREATQLNLDAVFGAWRANGSRSLPRVSRPYIALWRDIPSEVLPPVSMNKKKLFLPTRSVFHAEVAAQQGFEDMRRIIDKSAPFAAVRHHNFFMRFPWVPTMAPLDEGPLMASMVFTERVRRHASCTRALLPARFVAVHLRLEEDSKLIRPKAAADPSAKQIMRFLKDAVFPVAREHQARAILLCTGTLGPQLRQVLRDWDIGTVTLHVRPLKGAPEEARLNSSCAEQFPLPQAVGAQRGHHSAQGVNQTQDHYGSAVDLQLLGQAAAAVVPDYSTFRIAVFARRCYYSPPAADATQSHPTRLPQAASGVLSYTVGLDGSFTKPKLLPCSEAARGWAGHRSWGTA